jgi:hypothetical protein
MSKPSLLTQWLEARGVTAEPAVKSVALLWVSWPSGERPTLDPGGPVIGGAGAAAPSTNAFDAVP